MKMFKLTLKFIATLTLSFFSLSLSADLDRLGKNIFNTGRHLESAPYPITSYESNFDTLELQPSFMVNIRSLDNTNTVFDAGAGSALAWYDLALGKTKEQLPKMDLYVYSNEGVNQTFIDELKKKLGDDPVIVGDFNVTAKKEENKGKYDLGVDNNGVFAYTTDNIHDVMKLQLEILKNNGVLYLVYDEYMYRWREKSGPGYPRAGFPEYEGAPSGPGFFVVKKGKRKEVQSNSEKMVRDAANIKSELFTEEYDGTEEWFRRIQGANCRVKAPEYDRIYGPYNLEKVEKLGYISYKKGADDHFYVKTPREEINRSRVVRCRRNDQEIKVDELVPLVIEGGRPPLRIYAHHDDFVYREGE